MPEETVVADPTPAVETPSLEVPRSSSPEYAEWRKSGTLPDKPKTEEAASSIPPETAGESETPQSKQEPKPKQTAEERIAQLEATIEKIRKGSEQKKTPITESSPVKTEPKSFQHPPTRIKPTIEDKKENGTAKFDTYEDFVEDLSDWKAEQREVTKERERQEAAANKAFDEIREKAEAKYENFAEVVGPFATVINEDQKISPVVRRMFLDSSVTADLLYAIGSDAAEQAKFVKMAKEDPGKAIRYVAKVESLIEAELSESAETTRNEKGQFAKEPTETKTPVKRGPESAPAPPLEVGSRGSGTMDESDRAFQAVERGDPKAVRAWMAAENAKELRRRKGI